jgi:signal transduction histidine kinase
MELFLNTCLVSLFYLPGFYVLIYSLAGKTADYHRRLYVSFLLYTGSLWIAVLLLSSFVGTQLTAWFNFLFIGDLILSFFLAHQAVQLKLPSFLFDFFLIKCYSNDVIILALLLRQWLRQIAFLEDMFTGTVFAVLFIYLLTMPSLLYFSDRLLSPLLRAETPPEFHRLWYVPFSFFLLLAASLDGLHYDLRTSDLYSGFLMLSMQGLGTFLSSGFFLQMLQEDIKNRAAQEQLRTNRLYMTMQRREYDRLQQTIDHTRKIRHDIRQQLTVIKGMAQEKDHTALLAYIDNYLHHSGLQAVTTICDNYAANSLIQYYLAQAQVYGVAAEHKISLPPKLPMDESDFAAILGNMLENALEACKAQTSGRRFLTVRVEMVGSSMLALAVTNSFNGLIEKEGEAFISSKRTGHQEGIGIASIKSLAAQYNGITSFEYQDQKFTAKVLLNF